MPNTAPIVVPALETNYPPALLAKLKLIQEQGANFFLHLPFDFSTADAATLFTVPTGYDLYISRAFWKIVVSMTGGTTPAIGVSSDDTNHNTKGDILGGASGDLTATLVSTGRPYKGGTLGAKYASNGVIVIPAGKIIRFDRIADAFTAGSGYVVLHGSFVPAS
jgi:hypothetical protein